MERLTKAILPDPSAPTPNTQNLPLIEVLLALEPPVWLKDVSPTIAQLSADQAQEAAAPSGIGWLGDALNDSQREAIEFCLKAEHVACIHGPPGVGQALASLIKKTDIHPDGKDTYAHRTDLPAPPPSRFVEDLAASSHTSYHTVKSGS